MRKLSVFLALLFIMTSCGRSTPQFEAVNYEQTLEFSEAFDTDVIPKNAMSAENVDKWLSLLSVSQGLVPSMAALTSEVIFNNTLKSLKSGDQEKSTQEGKLNKKGQQFRSRLLNQCQRKVSRPATKNSINSGELLERQIAISFGGSQCPMDLQDSLVSNIHFDKIQSDKTTKHANVLIRVNNIRDFRRHLEEDAFTEEFIQILEFKTTNKSYIEYVDEVYKKKNFVFSQAEGSLSLQTSRGKSLKGSLKVETLQTGTWKETRFLFLGNTDEGQFRWVMKSLNKNYLESSVNGEMREGVEVPYEIQALLYQLY